MKIQIGPNDHLKIEGADDEGKALCMLHRENGEVEPLVAEIGTADSGPTDRYWLDRCPEAARHEAIYHVSEVRQGPPLVNSRAYCESYERMFGNKKAHA